jgi:two-component system sensor histidine kinase KdpD
MTAARWAFSHHESAGFGTDTLPTVRWYFEPLRTARGTLGVVGVAPGEDRKPLDPEARVLLDTLAEQTAAALDRASLAAEIASARSAAETERVRNTLLASISHDFRTPLSSILGSSTTLIDYGEEMSDRERADLLRQIKDEAEGLDGMVRDLLAIARIDAGALELRRDWIDLREVVERAISSTRRRDTGHRFTVNWPAAGLPLVRADARLSEQAVGNVVANAVAHTPAGTNVRIDAEVADNLLRIRISDDGAGIPEAILPHVFDKFVRSSREPQARADGGDSVGLGLAIAKGIMEAHGGTISAESPVASGRGTRVTLSFPCEEIPK